MIQNLSLYFRIRLRPDSKFVLGEEKEDELVRYFSVSFSIHYSNSYHVYCSMQFTISGFQ